MKILAGDIGGTKTLLQIVEVADDNNYHIYHEARFTSAEWLGFIPLVEEFLRAAPCSLATACFAVAGPGDGQRAVLTNLSWTDMDAIRLASYFGIRQVLLINDFQAIGYGIAWLAAHELATLQAGQERRYAPRVLLGAGTGLGQSILIWIDGHYLPLDTEGGHVDFAPQDEEQTNLLHFLWARHDHVSYERLLSGTGLVAIYHFLGGVMPAAIPQFEQAATISHAALIAQDPVAVHALRLFARIYGQQAGNLALTGLARGGVYVAGGIAPRILPFLQDGEFIRAFRAKGRMEPLLREIPVHVVLNPQVGLLGATMVAADRLKASALI